VAGRPPFRIRAQRFLRGLGRTSPEQARQLLAAKGWTAESFTIREVREAEIPALAQLHAITWAATYPGVRRPPTAALRESQWREAFAKRDGSWFCLVVEAPDGTLVGFAKGIRRPEAPPVASGQYAGDLNKIYLLNDYQRLGLGRRMVGEVARRFIAMGITSMILFADEGNPTCAFYEALGGHNVPNNDGTLNYGNFGWHDIRPLAAL
jgi:ribosomal protein S18 acetylase RimI-like enzyme